MPLATLRDMQHFLHNRNLYLPLTTLLLLLAAGVRLHQLDGQSLWFDEGWSAYAATRPTLWAAATADATNPPLYYTLLHSVVLLIGQHIFSMRWFSFAFGILAVALTARLARRVSGGTAMLVAVLLAAVNIPLVWASQEMRMYTLLAVLIVVIALAWEQLRTQPTRTAWVALLLAELAVLYTHNTGPVVVLWLNTVTLLAWGFHFKPGVLPWLLGQVMVGALWLPYFATRFLQVAGANNALVRRTAPGADVWGAFWLAPWEALTDQPNVSFFALPLLLIIMLLAPWRQPAVRWIGVHIILLTGGLLLALAVLGNELHGRYLVMVVPLVVGLAGAALGRDFGKYGGLVRLGLLVPFIVVSLLGWGLLRDPAYTHDDARGMVRHYAEELTAADTVLAWSYADRYELAYYWDAMDVPAQRVTLPEGADLPALLPLLPTGGDVSLNVWYTQRADYRGMMSCVLGHGTTDPPAFYEVAGMATLTYQRPALQLPASRPASARFNVASVDAMTLPPEGFTANRAVCLPVTITLQQATPAELKAAVIAVNPLGEEVARADAVFATANQRTSTDGTVGASLTAYPLLRLPYGAPPAEYTLKLRLYDESSLSGYDLLVDGSAAGKDWEMGTWVPAPGADWVADAPRALRLMTDIPLPEAALRNGDQAQITLLWEGDPAAPLPPLELAGEGWAVDVPPTVAEHDDAVLDWRAFQVPIAATAGQATLSLPDGTVLAGYTITEIPLQTEPPPVQYSADAVFAGIGTLVGYDVAVDESALTVSLVWRATENAPTARDYTVFVQLLGAGGQVITQSDASPAAGARPTTGWRPGEIIVDEHMLPLPPDADLTQARLITGMYDGDGNRAELPDGRDFATLPAEMPPQ